MSVIAERTDVTDLEMTYYEMPSMSYEDLKKNCDRGASFLKRGFVGSDVSLEPVEQQYPSDLPEYLRTFLEDE